MNNENTSSPFEELRVIISRYIRQELGRPLANLVSWAIFGFLGSLLVATGCIFLFVGLVRLLQNETRDVFDDPFSWAPYLIVMVVVIILNAIGIKFIRGRKGK